MANRIRLKEKVLERSIASSRLSQNRWAQKLGVGRGHLSLLIHGKRPYPSRKTREKLLSGLGLEFEDLFEVEHESAPIRRHSLRPKPADVCEFQISKSWRAPSMPPSEGRGDGMMYTLEKDLLYGIRLLVKNPAFSLVAVLALALGIGANTLLFSVVNATLIQELPFENPDRLVMVWEHNYVRGRDRNVVSPANYLVWKERNRSFEEMAAFLPWEMNLTGAGEPVRIKVGLATPNLFTILKSNPALGRALRPEDGEPGAADVIVLSHGFWQRHFGSNPDVLGTRVEIDGQAQQIVGVMQSDFDVPSDVELWVPYQLDERHRNAAGRYLSVLARLRPEAGIEQAQAEMVELSARMEKEFPERQSGWSTNVVSFHEQLTGDLRPALLILLGAVAFVLLIGCANVANLLLARASVREKEMAIRSALGAGRGRLMAQLLTESLLLSAVGGAAGLALAYAGLQLLPGILPAEIPAFLKIELSGQVLAFTAGLSVLAALFFGMAPALRISIPGLNEFLKDGGRTSVGSDRRGLRNLLVIGEVALALVLLIGAGLLIKSFSRLQNLDPGFKADGVLSLQISLPSSKYPRGEQQARFFDEAIERIRTIPEVKEAGAISWLPLGGPGSATSFTLGDRPQPAAGEEPVADVRMVTPGYLQTMATRLLKGRYFTPDDKATSPMVVVINAAMAREFWDDGNALGKEVIMEWGPVHRAEIVGIVEDVRLVTMDTAPRATIYWVQSQLPNNFMTLMVRSAADPGILTQLIREEIKEIDPDQPLASVALMPEVVSESLKRPRFTVTLLTLFAALAFFLAAVGIYGVVSYSVNQRTHEIGVRMAFGARRGDVLRLVIAQGMGRVLIGLALGLVVALGLTRFLNSVLFEVSTTDPATFAVVALILAAVALLATLIPAARATAVEPVNALRYE